MMSSSRVRINYAVSRLLMPSATHGRFSRGAVNNLNEIRQDEVEHTQNRLDTTLADVFSLLSLFFLTIGRTKECPAIYCQIASMRVSAHIITRYPLPKGHNRLVRALPLPSSEIGCSETNAV
jgi:hypothetical protein